MAQEIWGATVTRVGAETAPMFEAGVYILFGEPVPPALADLSIVHDDRTPGVPDIQPGDRLTIGAASMTIDAVGDISNKNLGELGHTVVYLNSAKQRLLPGAIKATGQAASPEPGQCIAFLREE